MASTAWRGWYHLMANTYGMWLPGDPRGFRTRDHREHVEGDYRNPPPKDEYDQRWRQSRQSMKQKPVHLCPQARVPAVECIRHALVEVHGIEVLTVAINEVHLHLLARFPRDLAGRPIESGSRTSAVGDPPRHYLGIAKQWAAKTLYARGLVESAKVWARKGKIKPIADREHQVHVFHYILDHIDQGAAVWSFRDEDIRIAP